MSLRFLRCVGKALCKHSAKFLAKMVGLDAIYELAIDVWHEMHEEGQDAVLEKEIEEAASLPHDEAKRQAEQILAEIAPGKSVDERRDLAAYLSTVPGTIRSSLRRPEDPTGKTVPASVFFRRPEDLIPLLPKQMPIFKPGDRPLPGTDFELVELIGRGGFGEVWKARNANLKDLPPFVLKFATDETAIKNLRNEAGVLGRVMSHGTQGALRGFVRLLDTYLDASFPCLKYEYIDGGDLAGFIRELHDSGRASIRNVQYIFSDLVDIVTYAHQANPPIVHCDLKPANVLIQRPSEKKVRLRVADFGIGGLAASQALKETARPNTSQNALMTEAVRGAYTPLYASPQQRMRGREEAPDPRDDVHALGVIWYQLVTGDLAMTAMPPDWQSILREKGLPPKAIQLLGTCISSRAEKRPTNAEELGKRLSELNLKPDAAASSPAELLPVAELVAANQKTKVSQAARAKPKVDVGAQIEKWRSHLLDTSKRNRAINFKTGRTGGIEFVHPDPETVWKRLISEKHSLTFPWKQDLVSLPEEINDDEETDASSGREVVQRCLQSPKLRSDCILTEMTDQHLAARLSRLQLNARESQTEQGVSILFVAFGFLSWFEVGDSQAEIRSPLLLAPVSLERDDVESPWQISIQDEDILLNHSLGHLLASDFGIRLPAIDDEKADLSDPEWKKRYFAAVAEAVRARDCWKVTDGAALGTFNFQKLAMWEDLGRNQDRIRQHALCQAIAGDTNAKLPLPPAAPPLDKLDDETLADNSYHILDADSSQQAAILAATRGASLVLDGPPGTGKSQTIANTIAEFIAAGKTVLFVSEKAAALEVVKRRLDSKGLGDFCLDCHSHKANKRDIIAKLADTLKLPAEVAPNFAEDFRLLHQTRCQLNDYVGQLHAVRQPLGLSAYQVHGELAELAASAPGLTCPMVRPLERDESYVRRVTDALAKLPDCRRAVERHETHPWRGCQAIVYSLSLRNDIEHHFGRLARSLNRLGRSAGLFQAAGLCGESPTVLGVFAISEALRVLASCPLIPLNWFQGDPKTAANAYVRLDQLTQRYRKVRASLSPFDAARSVALSAADLKALRGMLEADRYRERAKQPDIRIRDVAPRLAAIRTMLQEFAHKARTTDRAATVILTQLQIKASGPALKQPHKFARFAKQIAKMKSVRPEWWDKARRAELEKAAMRCKEEFLAAHDLRLELMERLSPEAFHPDSAPLSEQASQYRGIFSRLFGGWRACRNQIKGWYSGTIPGTRALLADMAKLADFHRKTNYCRQVQSQYRSDIVKDGTGAANWDATLEGLASVNVLEEISKVPGSLQALISEGKIDRKALGDAATALQQQAGGLAQGLEAMSLFLDVSRVWDGVSSQVVGASGELADWAERQLEDLAREGNLLDRICGLLKVGEDISTAEAEARFAAVAELHLLRAEIVQLRDRLGLEEEKSLLEDRDWSKLSIAAESLLAFLAKWNRPIAAAHVRALTSPAVRAQLASALEEAVAARQEDFEGSWNFLRKLFDPSREVSTGIVIDRASPPVLASWLKDRCADVNELDEWTRLREVERELEQAELPTLISEICKRGIALEGAGYAFKARFLSLWLDALYVSIATLRQFRTEPQERLIDRFRELDRKSVAVGPQRVRASVLSQSDRPRAMSGDLPASSELSILLREANKKTRHLPLRRLFASVPTVLLRLTPCVMMSPLAVSTFLQSPELMFDLVIFDEASQVRPHDAICAVYRGRQLLVAGDQKQLPPTTFFERAVSEDSSDDEEVANLGDYESLLDVCCTLGLPRRRLRWHYRSRREPLIAFANRHVYDDELVTFPSVADTGANRAIAFNLVKDGRWKSGTSGGFNSVEARRVAEQVLAHFKTGKNRSLGVIAFNQRQQMAILEGLETLRRENPRFEKYFQEDLDEPFFVKNLENVQGDERDVIFLSVGYGPDEAGNIAMRFGPLNRQGGHRRLNVAITRAREAMTVISSLRAQDIDVSRSSAQGVRLLKDYLDFAERGPASLIGNRQVKAVRESKFEEAVCRELMERGVAFQRDVGCGEFRIDFAVTDPQDPTRFLLGIECDGRIYRASPTARDRERLRHEVLQGLGWRIMRIWSADWLRDKEAQVRRVMTEIETAQQLPLPVPQAEVRLPANRVAPSGPNPGSSAKAAAPSFESIDDVPEQAIVELIMTLLRDCGATGAEELSQSVSRTLGFKRRGNRILTRIDRTIQGLLSESRVIKLSDERLQAAPAPAA